jgi:hypothetical protein
VNVASVLDLATFAAADSVAVAEGHGEVGEGSDEAHDASDKTVKSVILDFGDEVCVDLTLIKEAKGIRVPRCKEEPESREEEEGESNPQDDTGAEARAGHVDSAGRAAAVGSGGGDLGGVGDGTTVGLLLLAVPLLLRSLLEVAVAGLLGFAVVLGSVLDRSRACLWHTSATGVLARSLSGAVAEADLGSLHVLAAHFAVGLLRSVPSLLIARALLLSVAALGLSVGALGIIGSRGGLSGLGGSGEGKGAEDGGKLHQ